MPSEPPEDRASTPQSQSRSKQERIRDNQRRSRARRQEYLADLEKRLSECQITCRDADIQRAAFIELQIENTRLRELLSLAGVNDQFVEHYVSQAVAQSTQFPQEANPALRQLKPKIAAIDPNRMLSSNASGGVGGSSSSNVNNVFQPSSASASASTSASAPPRRHSHNVMSSTPAMTIPDQTMTTPATSYSNVSSFVPPQSDMSSPATFDWLYQQSPLMQTQSTVESYLCDAFGMPVRRSSRPADDSTVLCSVAKQMIDQYHIPPQEMDMVKAKLSRGCFQPSFPGAGCSVDNQVLFQVLNELSAKYS